MANSETQGSKSIKLFKVLWEVLVSATTPKAAAKQAINAFNEGAKIFDVIDNKGVCSWVHLDTDDVTEMPAFPMKCLLVYWDKDYPEEACLFGQIGELKPFVFDSYEDAEFCARSISKGKDNFRYRVIRVGR